MGTQASKLSIRQNNKVEKTAKSATLPTPAQSQNTLEEFIQRAVDNPGEHTLTPAVVQTLQRTHGNHFVQRLVAQARQKNAARGKTSKADLKVTPRGSGFVQRLAYDDPPASWNADAVRRSGEGVAGVFFVDKGPDTVVVKPLDDPGNVEFANKFMEEGMGFEAPQTMSYAKTSGDGTTIKDLLVANKHVGRTPDEVETQIAGANYFVVMDMVAGKSIQRLDDNEAMGFITDANALKDVGRLMMADAFLGNTDRLVGGNVNLGNFFYAAAGTINAKVTTIDNDSKFQQGGLQRQRQSHRQSRFQDASDGILDG